MGVAQQRVLHKVFVIVNGLESANNARFGTDSPDEIFMCDSVGHAHALFVDNWQPRVVNGGRIITLVAQVARIIH